MPTASIADFYDSEHWGNPFKATSPGSHSGLDIKGHRRGRAIPMLHSGILVASGYHPDYGYYAGIATGDGWHDTYSHMFEGTGLDLNRRYGAGEIVSGVGNTGDLSDGDHLHLGRSRSPFPWVRPTVDPKPGLRLVLQGLAGGGGTPLPIEKEDEMIVISDGPRTALVSYQNFQTLTPAEIPVAKTVHGFLSVSVAAYNIEQARAVRAAEQERAAIATAVLGALPPSSGGGQPVDLQPVLDGLSSVELAVASVPAETREKFRSEPLK